MSIYKRTIILICGTFLVLMALVYTISSFIYRQGFEDLERNTVENNITQVTEALSVNLDTLDAMCYDWAEWDDTYEFAQEYNQEYVDRNLQDDTFYDMGLSLVCVFNTSEEMVYGKAYDIINTEEIILPDDFINIVITEGLVKPAVIGNAIAGVMLFTGQPMLAVSQPIMTSWGEGPIAGALIFGRIIDAKVISHLAETTHLSVNLLPIPTDDDDLETSHIIEALDESGPTLVQAQNGDTIAGYTYVNDLSGNPVFVFEVMIPRDIFHQGTKAIALLHSLLAFIGIVFCIVFILLVKKLILARLTKLSNNVSQIGSSGDVTRRVTMPGNDELSRLAKNINEMLRSLENASKALRESEEKFSKAFHASPQEICITRLSDGKIIDINESFTRFSGYTREEIIGRNSSKLGIWTKPDEREKMLKMIRTNGRVQNEEFEFRRKSGDIRTQLFSAEKIIINGEECIISIMTDITERKRAEKLQADEIELLTLLGRGIELDEVLDATVRLGEAHNPTIKGSILLFDVAKGNLVHAAGPSLPDDYVALLKKGVPIGPSSGSCGTAAYRKARVIIPDIKASHAYPDEMVNITMKNGLLACWSQPIIGSHGELLGTIANYSTIKGMPSTGDLRVTDWSARIAALAFERKKAERALKESEEKFSKAFRASPDAIAISKLSDGAFLDINDSYTRITGYTRGEVIGHKADRFNMWGKAEQREKMLQKIQNREKLQNEELSFRAKSGEIRTLLLSTEYVYIGDEPCLLVVSTDITEYKKMEEALLNEATRRRILIEQSSEGIVVLDQNGGVYEANRRFAEMLGYSPEEVLKMNVWDWEFLYPPEQVREMIRTVDEAGDHFETRHRRKDGTTYDVEISTNGAMFAGQKLIFCVCRDITERKRMEKALKESEEKFSIAFRSSPNTMAITTEKEGRFIEINDSHTRLTGYTREEAIGHTALELGLWAKAEDRARMLNILKTQGRVDNEEFEFRMKSGEMRNWLFSAEHITIGGEPCLISITTDITELRRMEQALLESEEKFSKAFHASPAIVAITTLESGQYIEVNDSYIKATGYSRKDLIGRTSTDVNVWVKPEDRARLLQTLKEQGRVRNEEFDFRMKSGEIRTWLFSGEQIKIAGEPCLIGVSIDITERNRAEEALREREKRFSDIAENAMEWIWEVDARGKYTYSSPVVEKILGYNHEEILKKHFYDLFLPEEREELKKAAFAAFTQKQPIKDFINKNRCKNGKTVELLTSGVPVIDETGNLLGYRGVDTDITERRRAEQALKESMANLEQSSNQLAATNKELEAFSYSVSHDLRAPLRSIDGFSQALLEDYEKKFDKTGQDYLRRLRAASQKMGELIDGILKLSRLTRSEMHHVPINLSTLAEEIANRLQEMQPERRVKFDIAKDLTANGDPQLLKVLLENLLDNAWKFTSKKTRAKIEFSMNRNNGKKAFFVRDNGVGFDMTYADRLFGAFQRLHEATEFPGTGIGLATVKRIIHRHGGTIWAEGAVGKGATFHFTLD